MTEEIKRAIRQCHEYVADYAYSHQPATACEKIRERFPEAFEQANPIPSLHEVQLEHYRRGKFNAHFGAIQTTLAEMQTR